MNSKPLFLHDNMNKYFFNREYDIKRISYQINSVRESLAQHLLITGIRGVGKSYLIKKIISETEHDIICVYIDFSKVYSSYDEDLTMEIILTELLKVMNDSVNNQEYTNKYANTIKELIDNVKLKNYDFGKAKEIFKIPIPEVETDYRKLSQFVMEFPQKIVDTIDEVKGFVIFIDEFQTLTKMDNLDKFFWLIRSYTQTQHNTSYVFTGSISRTSKLIDEINGDEGAFGGRLNHFEIKPFSEVETRKYFDECMPEIEFTDDGFDRFYKCTRGIPLYVNSFYNVMDSSVVYSADVVKETFFMNMSQILFRWFRIWSNLNENEKEIVEILIENDGLTWTDLLEKTSVSRGTFNDNLKTLGYKGIIGVQNKLYFIEDNLLKSWLKHEKEVYGSYPD